jgi:hypothetical protein
VWNPHQFSGTPFAGDPESGWTYLPAMLWFTLLPLGAAARVYVADGALRAVSVPGGRYSVEFQYTSAALPLGVAITGLTLLALVVAIAWPRRER